jgi:hypothetical protein
VQSGAGLRKNFNKIEIAMPESRKNTIQRMQKAEEEFDIIFKEIEEKKKNGGGIFK